MNFDGIWVPAVTPFTSDNSIDYATFRTVISTLIDKGVHGLIVGGTTGEYYAISLKERVELVKIAVEISAGRTPIVAGINSTSTDESLQLGRAVKALGVDALLIAAPYYCQPTQDELLENIITLDDALDLPVMLYNFPDRTGTQMSFELLEALRKRPNIQSIKESTGSVERMHHLVLEFGDDIQLCCGMDDQVLEFFVWGAKSWVCGAGNFLAEEHLALYQACVIEQDFVKGRALATQLMPVLNLLEQGGKFCQYIKYGCELTGLHVGDARRPLTPPSEVDKAAFKTVIDTLIADRG